MINGLVHVNDVSEVHPDTNDSGIFIALGKVILVKLVHPENIPAFKKADSIVIFGKTTTLKDVQFPNAFVPILINFEFGSIVIVVKFEQPINALVPIVSIFEPKFT
jgi:hypothetical protein